jgi:hypothetical protein
MNGAGIITGPYRFQYEGFLLWQSKEAFYDL